MTFLTTPAYLHSLLPSEQRSLKNTTSVELLLRWGSQKAVLAKSSLALFFSVLSLQLHLQHLS